MLINQTQTEVVGINPTGFTIKASPKAFKILSDTLYKYKKEAIIRELSTNALDAQKESGSELRYQLFLPDQLNNEFRLRDFGTGLDAEQIEHLYTTYFESTKDQDNDYIGALGLGSKSPFAYTKELTVTSYKNGTMYVYLIKSIDDTPTYTKLVECPTDQLSGLEIKFFVAEGDNTEFEHAYHKVMTGIDQDKLPESNIEPKFSLIELIPNVYKSNCFDHSSVCIRMGQIIYPLDTTGLIEKNDFAYFAPRIVIDVPLGSVEIHPSREALDYTQVTKDFLVGFLEDTKKKLLVQTQKDVDKEETIRKAYRVVTSKGFPTSWFTYKETELSKLTNLKIELEEITNRYQSGWIGSDRASSLISPRFKYQMKYCPSLLSKVVLLINTSKFNQGNTLKHLGFKHPNSVIVMVDKEKHKLIGMYKKVYQEDLLLYTTCDKDLKTQAKRFQEKREVSQLIPVLRSYKSTGGYYKTTEIEVEREDLEKLKNTFSGTRRGRNITISEGDKEIWYTVDTFDSDIIKLIHDEYGEFNIVLGVANKKYIKNKTPDLFNKIESGKYSSVGKYQIDRLIFLGYDFGSRKSLEGTRNNISANVIKKTNDICLYRKILNENKLISHIVTSLGCYNESTAYELLTELKEMYR